MNTVLCLYFLSLYVCPCVCLSVCRPSVLLLFVCLTFCLKAASEVQDNVTRDRYTYVSIIAFSSIDDEATMKTKYNGLGLTAVGHFMHPAFVAA